MRLAAALAALTVLAPVATADARTAPCRTDGSGGPACTVWTGKVVHVHDGDTLEVRVGGRPLRVRVTGIQAMEQRVYSSFASRRRGECHAVAATNRFERLVRRSRGVVRLSAQQTSSRSGKRWRRSVAVRAPGGGWQDVGRTLVAEGHALWLPNPDEWAWNSAYGDATERARANGRNLWDPDACGAGPSAAADIAVRVNWDAEGVDFDNVNGEWIRVHNRSGQDVRLGGWWVRDSALRRFTFPASAVAPAGGSVTVEIGRGGASGSVFHWGLPEPVFENPAGDGRGIGDGGYLFDPDGDLRAAAIYR